MIETLMISGKLATPDLLKMRDFEIQFMAS